MTPAMENYRRRAHDPEAQVLALSRQNEALQEEVNRLHQAAVPLFTVSEDMMDDADVKSCLQGVCPAAEEVRRLKSQGAASSDVNANSNAQLQEKIAHLRNKYNQAKVEKREMRNAREAADSNLQAVTARMDDALKARDDARNRVRELEMQFQSMAKERDAMIDNTQRTLSWWEYMDNLPPAPVGTGLNMNLTIVKNPSHYMTKELKAICAPHGIITLTDQLIWVSEHSWHAIVISTSYDYNAAASGSKIWTKRKERREWLGKTHDIFFRVKHAMPWNYAGTFKFIGLHSLTVDEYRQLSDRSKKALIQHSIHTPLMVPPMVLRMIADLYEKGIAKVECTELQCVGFNHELYEAFKECGPKPQKRKSNNDAASSSRKKAKTN